MHILQILFLTISKGIMCSNFSQTLLIHCVDLVKCLMLLNASVKVRQCFCGTCICTHPHISNVNMYMHNVIYPPKHYKPTHSVVASWTTWCFSITLWASLSFCQCFQFKANPFWSHLLFWHSYARTSSALSEAYASITPFTCTKKVGQIQVESRFEPDNTFHTCETTLDEHRSGSSPAPDPGLNPG